VPVEQVAASQPREGGGLPVVPIVGAVAVLVVAAAVYRWRR
jgi:cobalamin biosynthesis Mg chelatase CobN